MQIVDHLGGWAATQHLLNFDPLADRSPYPTIVQLCDSDDDNSHVIAITGDWLFDSNRPHTIPLVDRSSLDACCIGHATFKRVSATTSPSCAQMAARRFPCPRVVQRAALCSVVVTPRISVALRVPA